MSSSVAISWIHRLISFLPSNRHYLPSILVLYWTESLPGDIESTLDDFQRKEIINAWSSLAFANDSTHFDDQFSKMIHALPVDLTGRLADEVTLDGQHNDPFISCFGAHLGNRNFPNVFGSMGLRSRRVARKL